MIDYTPVSGGRVGRPSGRKKLSSEQELEMVRLYHQENRRGAVLAKLFGCSNTHVYRVIRRHGKVKGRARGQEDLRKIPVQDEVAVVWRYAEARERASEIALSYECSLMTVYDVLERYGVPRHFQAQSQAASKPRKRKHRTVLPLHVERRLETMGLPAARNNIKYEGPPGVTFTPDDELQRSNDALKEFFANKEKAKTDVEAFKAWREKHGLKYVLPKGQPARSLKQTEEMFGLPPVKVEKRVIPTVQGPTKIQASTRNGQVKAPLRVKFPPLPGEPGYKYEDAA